jgi:hypothetical protein
MLGPIVVSQIVTGGSGGVEGCFLHKKNVIYVIQMTKSIAFVKAHLIGLLVDKRHCTLSVNYFRLPVYSISKSGFPYLSSGVIPD